MVEGGSAAVQVTAGSPLLQVTAYGGNGEVLGVGPRSLWRQRRGIARNPCSLIAPLPLEKPYGNGDLMVINGY